jgi:muramidase (phage lysozyme)
MSVRQHVEAALLSQNAQAWLRLLRWCEGTGQDDRAYRMFFGGALFDSLADHPRRTHTFTMKGRPITSSAAGAYQFLARTWDECRDALRLPDFGPRSQDLAALFLTRRRGALDDVLAGRIEDAIRKCAREWASLPGSPYGQPVKTLAECLRVYQQHGGTIGAPGPVQAPAQAPAPSPAPKEADMPLPAFVAAALPAIIDAAPKLARLLGSGSEVAERNIKAAELAVSIVQQATGTPNAQAAAEAVRTDPEAARAAAQAIEAHWFELAEAGGGGIEGAHKRSMELMASGKSVWNNPAFVVSAVLLLFPLMLMIDVFWVNPGAYSGELRVQIVTAILAVIAMIGSYWIGTSFSSARKDEQRAR